ncbi:hypothetical protein HYPBUDRAFT_151842 [Hyphopichia burtonii NRRL Y-1933]|uniref:Uncharacterized protein n=1 Tax=Hyphopichia burtonii NRRL Y-1933 TaxID=984485 RepID=A0A1E4RM29_9ASCO|nr:hypothetical protein HYPBUDRAFT_151842 [Hyphopichia burtonii NRRL Y-1933]ODV68323.1 hypothetical protein HYPBUDRAFT_151842 [Hyphopichia burtonii NRRL Y-1933]
MGFEWILDVLEWYHDWERTCGNEFESVIDGCMASLVVQLKSLMPQLNVVKGKDRKSPM